MIFFCNKCKQDVHECDNIMCQKKFKKGARIVHFQMHHYCSMRCAREDDNAVVDKVVDEYNKWDEDSY